MNLSSGWFGCVPYCCGSGGLAGQYKFGARTGLSVIILGIIKIFFGLLFGDSLTILFKNIPNSILGIMLIVAGLQLSLTIVNYDVDLSNDEKQSAFLIILIITASIIGFSNVGIGFLIGTVVYLILKVQSEAALNTENNDDSRI
jgi:MFS superfamily sulfate permease-like transporter